MTELPEKTDAVLPIPETVPLRFIAIVEFGKGLVAVLAATGFALHRETGPWVRRLATHLHFDPASDSPNALMRAMATGASSHARLIAFGAMFYAFVRIAEGIGLWYDKRWASWVGLFGAVAYLPYEIVRMIRHPTWLTLVIIVITAGAVSFLAYHLRLRLARA